jgi:hypothetical protein
LKIPTQSINKIKDSCYGGAFTLILEGYNISLIDGSLYTNCMPITNQLSFLTLAGEQRVVIFRTEREGFLRKQSWSPYRPKDSEVSVDMKGATAKDVGDLRQRLVFAFENSMEKIIETIGKEQFSKYFVISE